MKHFSFCRMTALLLLMLAGRSISAFGQDVPLVNVTFKLEFDQSKFMYPFQGVKIWNEKMKPTAQYYMGMDIVTDLAPGTYDMMTLFQTMEEAVCYFVIKEQVEIKNDTTIIMSPEMATNFVSVKNYGPDGELLKLDLGEYDETGQWHVVEPGNVAEYRVSTDVFFKDYSVSAVHTTGYTYDRAKTIKEQTMSMSDFYVTDVSNRFLFSQTRIARTETLDKWYVSYFSTDNVKNGNLENSPADYYLTHETMTYSPSSLEKVGCGSGVAVIKLYNGVYSHGDYLMKVMDDIEKEEKTADILVYSNMPFEDANDPQLQLLTNAIFHNNDYIQEVGFGHWLQRFLLPLSGQPFAYIDGQKVYMNVGKTSESGQPFSEYYNTVAEFYGNNMLKKQILPVCQNYTYPESMMLGNYNDCCPIIPDPITNDVYVFYVGQYGETITCLRDSVLIEDNEVNGVHDLTLEYADVMVDGLLGKNVTKAHYDDNAEDKKVPTLTMLQFRRDDGCITDRFETGADGTMEFSAADFVENYIPELFGSTYSYKPVDLTVEYSPYNEESWTQMEIEETTGCEGIFGWGYFYRASLQDVQGNAEKGWFDVRFTMSDEAGNTHVQTVSPAFRIDDLVTTCVKNVNAGEKSVVARYGLDGKRVDALQKGINIVRLQNGEVRKAVVK